jgi:acyl carrier protein
MAEGGRLSSPSVETEVRQLLARMLGSGTNSGGDMRRADLAQWDSLKHVEIVFALEDQFGVRFDESEFATLDSVPAIAAAVLKRHGA